MFETYERVSGNSFYDLKSSTSKKESVDLSGEPKAFFAELSQLRDRFWDAMEDDFNTGGAIGFLHDMIRLLNGFVADQKLETGKTAAALDALTTGMTLFKELSNILGVFIKPIAAEGADDGLANDLMELIIALRANARKEKQWAIADQIRDGLNALNIVLEDRPEKTSWKRG
ncbi:MAG: DALR domain-containing protein [Planctomycetaceae bacterium]